MSRHTPELLDTVWRYYATSPHGDLSTAHRLPGVDRLTGKVLEERVAIEACR